MAKKPAPKKKDTRPPNEKLRAGPASEEPLPDDGFTFGIERHIWVALPDSVRNRLVTQYLAEEKRKKKDALWLETTKAALKGRPPKYQPWMDEAVLAVYATGGFDPQAATAIGVDDRTLQAWATDLDPDSNGERYLYPSFSAAVDKGRRKSYDWWVAQGHEAVDGRPFNASLYALMMSNLHDFRTAKEDNKVDNTHKHSLDWVELAKEADAILQGKPVPGSKAGA